MVIKFKFFEHRADVKFRAYGSTLEKAFENSALAMFKVMSDEKIKQIKKKKIKVKGRDREALLYNFLEELLFLLDTENFFISKIKVRIKKQKDKFELQAECKGDDVKNYETKIDVKAVTYNEMFVKKGAEGWVCQVVVDV